MRASDLHMQTGIPLILASTSPTRAVLLAQAGLKFETRPARIDEEAIRQSAQAEEASPDDTATLLADLKARRVANAAPQALVIGADQILACEGRWFAKPETIEGARAQLLALRGRTHELVTSVVCYRGARIWHHVAKPRITFRPFSDAFLEEYLAAEGEEALRTVGGYRLEGRGINLMDRVEGDFFSILGLPLLPLLGFLRQHGALDP